MFRNTGKASSGKERVRRARFLRESLEQLIVGPRCPRRFAGSGVKFGATTRPGRSGILNHCPPPPCRELLVRHAYSNHAANGILLHPLNPTEISTSLQALRRRFEFL